MVVNVNSPQDGTKQATSSQLFSHNYRSPLLISNNFLRTCFQRNIRHHNISYMYMRSSKMRWPFF